MSIAHRDQIVVMSTAGPACYADDPFFIAVPDGTRPGRAACWQCRGSLGLAGWPSDRGRAVRPVLDLQRALMRTLRGHRAEYHAIEPSDARDLVNLVAGLLDLVVDAGDGEPLFARVAAVHWPAELRIVGRSIPESRFAYLPPRWRFLAMAVAAAVIVEPGHGTDDELTHPRRTLAASLTDAEWCRWEERMVVWPPAIRERLAAARRECC